MTPRKFVHRWLLLGLVLLQPVHGQEPEVNQLDTDIRLFTVLTAINVAGYDTGFGSPSDSAVRRVVRGDLDGIDGANLTRLKNFYEQFKLADPGANLSQYISFALMCGPPSSFEIEARLPTDLPPDVRRIRTLSPILAEFYREADIETLWNRYQAAYENVIVEYQEPLIQTVFEVTGYLRLSPTSRQVRSFRVLFELMGSPNHVYSRSYEGVVNVVVQASAEPRIEEVRDSYLMHLLDPLSIRYGQEIAKKSEMGRFALFAPALGAVYKENFQLLVSKSLANAVEARLHRGGDAKRAAMVDKSLREGFVLTPYFYEKLAEYEKQVEDFRHFYPEMIRGIDLKREGARLQNTKFSEAEAPKPAQPIRPRLSELDQMLQQAERLLSANKLREARKTFLAAYEKSGRKSAQALYGLGRLALHEADPDLARDQFTQALTTAPDPYVAAMSHIYIGRIEDVMGNREQAVQHYQLALGTEDPSTRTRELAQQGLDEPFGPSRDEEEEDDLDEDDLDEEDLDEEDLDEEDLEDDDLGEKKNAK